MKLTESQLKKLIKESALRLIKEDIYAEYEDESEAAIDFNDFIDVCNEHGISYDIYGGVNFKNGDFAGMRYTFHPAKGFDVESFVEDIKSRATNPDGIIYQEGNYRYAPEIKIFAITILGDK